jgi:hypothetical protein
MGRFLTVVLLMLCCLLLHVRHVDSFASWFVSAEYCDRALKEGEVIMNEIVASAEESVKSIRVMRNKEVLVSGVSQFKPGETLFVQLLDGEDLIKKGQQFVFEASGATFPLGGCAGRRSADTNDVDWLMPSDEYLLDSPVTVLAGWAPGIATLHRLDRLTSPCIALHRFASPCRVLHRLASLCIALHRFASLCIAL